jgi:ABC-type dipeptide/oligopeptide/nickel transport system permease subunit
MAVVDPGEAFAPLSTARARTRGGVAGWFTSLWDWLRADRRACIAIGFLVLVLLAGVLAKLFAQDPLAQNLDLILKNPSSSHWFGTDDLGRDVFSRLLSGGLVSLRAATIAVGVALLIGVPAGLIAGFRVGSSTRS